MLSNHTLTRRQRQPIRSTAYAPSLRTALRNDSILAIVLLALIGSVAWLATVAVDHWDIALPLMAFATGIGATLAWRDSAGRGINA